MELRFARRVKVIQRGRRFPIGVAGESDQADQIAEASRQFITTGDELARDILDGRQSIDRLSIHVKVHGLHTAASIHHHLDHDAFAVSNRLLAAFARPGQTNDDQHHGGDSQCRW